MTKSGFFKLTSAGLSLFAFTLTFGQSGDWYNLDYAKDSVIGVSVNQAYETIDVSTLQPVVVAVIDDGVDIKHPDFVGRIWTNEGETAGNGIDDDGNGYIDDVHGWNFLGNPSGENVSFETLEITRLYRDYRNRFEGSEPASLSKAEQKEYALYLKYKEEYDAEVSAIEEEFAQFAQLSAMYGGAFAYMQEKLGREELTLNDLLEFRPADEDEGQVVRFLMIAEQQGLPDYLESGSAYFERALEYNYNLDFDPRSMVNVDEAKAANTGYGNHMVDAEDPEHGTHVAGIIGAVRTNKTGVDGIAANAVIMPIRAIPGGDERDEDVALAIRYAADNGARVVNMSFGKAYSPRSELVFEAIKYAAEKDVLLIHAAGNDGSNNDKVQNFPDGTLGKNKTYANYITVAASGPFADSTLLAGFSNYGRKKVDVMAPGVEIESLKPEGQMASNSGTSMAAPVVTGIAVLLRGLYPELSAKEIKKIITSSTQPFDDHVVITDEGALPLKKLLRNPGIVSSTGAIDAARKRAE
jgi:subtilisin family serine protease